MTVPTTGGPCNQKVPRHPFITAGDVVECNKVAQKYCEGEKPEKWQPVMEEDN